MENETSLSINDITLISLFTALMAVCSWISIPAAIPFTLQTFGVFLTVGLLGGKRGTLVVIVYLLVGAIGLPVFSGLTGGIGHLAGPTGGYMVGFVLSALVMWGFEKLRGRSMKVLTVSMIVGLLICYAFGTLWFVYVYSKNTGKIGILGALGWCVFPYVLPDIVKIALAALLTKRLRPFIK